MLLRAAVLDGRRVVGGMGDESVVMNVHAPDGKDGACDARLAYCLVRCREGLAWLQAKVEIL